jgi:hypothetical protein
MSSSCECVGEDYTIHRRRTPLETLADSYQPHLSPSYDLQVHDRNLEVHQISMIKSHPGCHSRRQRPISPALASIAEVNAHSGRH